MATTEMTIKLVFDVKSNKVIFAEASKDFVDFLFFLLSLPIGTVIKLITSESMVGSIRNVYTSVENLDEKYLQPNMLKNILLNPMIFNHAKNLPLSLTESSIFSTKFYACSKQNCPRDITNQSDADCPVCFGKMKLGMNIKFIVGSEGCVKEPVSYFVSDELSVTTSATSIVLMMNKFNASNIEEKEVKVGMEQGLELLKTSFRSTTVLTDVFLGRKKVVRSNKTQK